MKQASFLKLGYLFTQTSEIKTINMTNHLISISSIYQFILIKA